MCKCIHSAFACNSISSIIARCLSLLNVFLKTNSLQKHILPQNSAHIFVKQYTDSHSYGVPNRTCANIHTNIDRNWIYNYRAYFI